MWKAAVPGELTGEDAGERRADHRRARRAGPPDSAGPHEAGARVTRGRGRGSYHTSADMFEF